MGFGPTNPVENDNKFGSYFNDLEIWFISSSMFNEINEKVSFFHEIPYPSLFAAVSTALRD